MSDLEELQRLIQEEAEKQTEVVRAPKDQNRDVNRFIRKTGLAPGENKVPTYVIYWHFIQWTRSTNWSREWKKEEFFRTFKKHFEQKRSGNQRFYLINDALELSEDVYKKAKTYDQKWDQRKQKKQR